jgi:YfiH family protein
LRCRPLEALAPHVFSTRQLQLSSDADIAALASAVGATRVVQATQVHGRAHATVRAGSRSETETRPEADIIVSNAPDAAVAVRAADCVPILLADRDRGAVAAVHAGWRGTCARAVVAAVEALKHEFDVRPGQLVAAIGPSIGVCCYEVGPALVDEFAAAGHERYLIQRWFVSTPPPRGSRAQNPLRLDLTGANRDQLVLAGVPEEQIHVSGLCTAMHLDVLTSYRAEREHAGRLVAAIRAARSSAA